MKIAHGTTEEQPTSKAESGISEVAVEPRHGTGFDPPEAYLQ